MIYATCKHCSEGIEFDTEGNYWLHTEWGWQRCPAETIGEPESGTITKDGVEFIGDKP